MGKTIRRKDVKGNGGYYKHKDEISMGKSAAYYHSDMPSRGGRWRMTGPAKEDEKVTRRNYMHNVNARDLLDEDVDLVNCDKVSRKQTNKHYAHY